MNKKPYKLNASPLYRISSVHVLAGLLQIDPTILKNLETYVRKQPKIAYRVFLQGAKKREIQQPINPKLVRIHRRVKELLSRIETPEYLFSGKRGYSYIDNAKAHLNANYLITLDISQFYASTRTESL